MWTGLPTGQWIRVHNRLASPYYRLVIGAFLPIGFPSLTNTAAAAGASLGCSYCHTPGLFHGKRRALGHIASCCFSRCSVSIRQMLNSMANLSILVCRLPMPIFPDCPLAWCSPYSRLQSTDTDCSTDEFYPLARLSLNFMITKSAHADIQGLKIWRAAMATTVCSATASSIC